MKPRYAPALSKDHHSLINWFSMILKLWTQHSSGNKKAEEEANKEAEVQLAEIKVAGKKSGDKVIKDLIHAVVEVKPEVPEEIAA